MQKEKLGGLKCQSEMLLPILVILAKLLFLDMNCVCMAVRGRISYYYRCYIGNIRSCTVSFIVFGKLHCFGTVDIFVISRQKWLKFGVQAHLFKMFGYTKFQLSISCTFKVMKLLVEITKKSNSNFLHKWAYHLSSVDFRAKVHS